MQHEGAGDTTTNAGGQSTTEYAEKNISNEDLEDENESSLMNASDIDLDASYSDDEYETIPINEKLLFDYQQKVEENNLFEMNLLQDNQQTLEKIQAECAQKIAAKRRKIAELDSNIA